MLSLLWCLFDFNNLYEKCLRCRVITASFKLSYTNCAVNKETGKTKATACPNHTPVGQVSPFRLLTSLHLSLWRTLKEPSVTTEEEEKTAAAAAAATAQQSQVAQNHRLMPPHALHYNPSDVSVFSPFFSSSFLSHSARYTLHTHTQLTMVMYFLQRRE